MLCYLALAKTGMHSVKPKGEIYESCSHTVGQWQCKCYIQTKFSSQLFFNDFLSDAVIVLSQSTYVHGVHMKESALEISQHVTNSLIHQK